MTVKNLKMLFMALIFAMLYAVPLSTDLRAETIQAPSDTSAAGELAFWNSIKTSDNPADFEVYLNTFPDGMFFDVAAARYQTLGGSTETVEAPVVRKKIVAPPPPKRVVYKKPAPKYVKSIFAKPKKVKQVVSYRKSYVKLRKPKVRASYVRYQKPRPVKYIKAKAVRYRPIVKPRKVYSPPPDDTNGNGGGGGGGNGGGWNG